MRTHRVRAETRLTPERGYEFVCKACGEVVDTFVVTGDAAVTENTGSLVHVHKDGAR